MLGIREVGVYGNMSLEDINKEITSKAKELDVEVEIIQSNHEGVIIDCIQGCYGTKDGIVINPGAFTHYSYGIRDAIAAVSIPTIEVHLSDIENREEFRKISVVKDVCITQKKGKGYVSYLEAIEELANRN